VDLLAVENQKYPKIEKSRIPAAKRVSDILVLGEKGYQAANLKQAYVSNSRFRQSQAIFTTDKEEAYESMAVDGPPWHQL